MSMPIPQSPENAAIEAETALVHPELTKYPTLSDERNRRQNAQTAITIESSNAVIAELRNPITLIRLSSKVGTMAVSFPDQLADQTVIGEPLEHLVELIGQSGVETVVTEHQRNSTISIRRNELDSAEPFTAWSPLELVALPQGDCHVDDVGRLQTDLVLLAEVLYCLDGHADIMCAWLVVYHLPSLNFVPNFGA
jgi:hypothetical protein